MEPDSPVLERLEDELASHAYLFERPSEYKAGVRDALRAVAQTLSLPLITPEE